MASSWKRARKIPNSKHALMEAHQPKEALLHHLNNENDVLITQSEKMTRWQCKNWKNSNLSRNM